jgi:hypothetical protein
MTTEAQREREERAVTYAELRDQLNRLTPEQLGMTAVWCGEDRGGAVRFLEVLAEDHINPSGDGMEPLSLYAKERAAEQDITVEEAERLIRAEERVVAPKGQLLLVVD